MLLTLSTLRPVCQVCGAFVILAFWTGSVLPWVTKLHGTPYLGQFLDKVASTVAPFANAKMTKTMSDRRPVLAICASAQNRRLQKSGYLDRHSPTPHSPNRMPRREYNNAQREAILRDQEASGLDARAYAAAAGIPVTTIREIKEQSEGIRSIARAQGQPAMPTEQSVLALRLYARMRQRRNPRYTIHKVSLVLSGKIAPEVSLSDDYRERRRLN